jgi:hypothetical protein
LPIISPGCGFDKFQPFHFDLLYWPALPHFVNRVLDFGTCFFQKSMVTLAAMVTGIALFATGLTETSPQETAGPCEHSQHDRQINQGERGWIHHDATR